MRRSIQSAAACAALGCALLLAASVSAQSQDLPPQPSPGTGKPTGVEKAALRAFFCSVLPNREAKQVATALANCITQAAHPTGANPDLLRYQITYPSQTRIQATFHVEYFGGFTGRPYPGVITMWINTADPDAWEVERMHFSDSANRIRPNEQNLSLLRRKLNGIFGQ
jgi:hypothetical protein